MKEIAESIAQMGLQMPIVVKVRKDKETGEVLHDVVDGECRYRAIQRLQEKDPGAYTKVPVSIWQGNEEDAYCLRLTLNDARDDHSPVDVGDWAVQMKTRGRSIAELAPKVGMSVGRLHVLHRIRVSCAVEVHEAIRQGQIAVDLVEKVFLGKDEKEQKKLLQKYLSEKAAKGVQAANTTARESAEPSRQIIPMKVRKEYLKVASKIAGLKNSSGAIFEQRPPAWWEGMALGIKLGMGKGAVPKELKQGQAAYDQAGKNLTGKKPAAPGEEAPSGETVPQTDETPAAT